MEVLVKYAVFKMLLQNYGIVFFFFFTDDSFLTHSKQARRNIRRQDPIRIRKKQISVENL